MWANLSGPENHRWPAASTQTLRPPRVSDAVLEEAAARHERPRRGAHCRRDVSAGLLVLTRRVVSEWDLNPTLQADGRSSRSTVSWYRFREAPPNDAGEAPSGTHDDRLLR
jgi:hypothetical protein